MPSCSLPWHHGNMYTWEYVMCLRCTGFLEATKITVGKARNGYLCFLDYTKTVTSHEVKTSLHPLNSSDL